MIIIVIYEGKMKICRFSSERLYFLFQKCIHFSGLSTFAAGWLAVDSGRHLVCIEVHDHRSTFLYAQTTKELHFHIQPRLLPRETDVKHCVASGCVLVDASLLPCPYPNGDGGIYVSGDLFSFDPSSTALRYANPCELLLPTSS